MVGQQQLEAALDDDGVLVPELDEPTVVVEHRARIGLGGSGVDDVLVRGDREPRLAFFEEVIKSRMRSIVALDEG